MNMKFKATSNITRRYRADNFDDAYRWMLNEVSRLVTDGYTISQCETTADYYDPWYEGVDPREDIGGRKWIAMVVAIKEDSNLDESKGQ